MTPKLSPFLWFDTQAKEAAEFYTSIFKDGKITNVQHYGEAGKEAHGQEAGKVMTVSFEINGQAFTALNGGSHFTFNPSISFVIDCEDQEEVDYYWDKLGESADPSKQQCGWVTDKFGLSWQVIPKALRTMTASPDREKSQRAFKAMMGMKKLDVAGLTRAFDGIEG